MLRWLQIHQKENGFLGNCWLDKLSIGSTLGKKVGSDAICGKQHGRRARVVGVGGCVMPSIQQPFDIRQASAPILTLYFIGCVILGKLLNHTEPESSLMGKWRLT